MSLQTVLKFFARQHVWKCQMCTRARGEDVVEFSVWRRAVRLSMWKGCSSQITTDSEARHCGPHCRISSTVVKLEQTSASTTSIVALAFCPTHNVMPMTPRWWRHRNRKLKLAKTPFCGGLLSRVVHSKRDTIQKMASFTLLRLDLGGFGMRTCKGTRELLHILVDDHAKRIWWKQCATNS